MGDVRLLDQVLQKAKPGTRITMLTLYLRSTNPEMKVGKKWRQSTVL